MRKKLEFIALAMLMLWPLAAFADDSDEFTIKVDPFHFGLGCLATWERDAGKPGQKDDSQQFGLYLQKNTATANFAAAGVRNVLRKPIPATSLQTLAFVISGFPGEPTFGVANGYCGAGSPRFNVTSTGTSSTCFLGCFHARKTQDPVTGWWEIKFIAPFTQFPGCENGVSGDVTSISIVFDEGNDLALSGSPGPVGNSPGNVVIDNIRVNNKVVGKPTDDD